MINPKYLKAYLVYKSRQISNPEMSNINICKVCSKNDIVNYNCLDINHLAIQFDIDPNEFIRLQNNISNIINNIKNALISNVEFLKENNIKVIVKDDIVVWIKTDAGNINYKAVKQGSNVVFLFTIISVNYYYNIIFSDSTLHKFINDAAEVKTVLVLLDDSISNYADKFADYVVSYNDLIANPIEVVENLYYMVTFGILNSANDNDENITDDKIIEMINNMSEEEIKKIEDWL